MEHEFRLSRTGDTMNEPLSVKIDRRGWVGILTTEGYINKQGGEELAWACYSLMDEGYKLLVLDLGGTKIINSNGAGIIIEIIEKTLEIDGRINFCNMTAVIERTFMIMGLGAYVGMFPD